jgi:predicted signal transduction protein with EAL and GGDEF domain
MVARLAGDEFAVLLVQTPRVADAARVAERIMESFAEPFTVGDHQVFAGASIGIVPSSGYTHPEDVLRDADIAMYRAKMGGRGNYRVFDAAMHADVVARLAVETDLRRALDRGEFSQQYQPMVALETGRISGLEALLRWQHPERGEITPTEFITIAEEIGVIIPLGWWALRQACTQMVEWTRDFPDYPTLSVSVNLSGRQFAQADLLESIQGALAAANIEPAALRLELTESVLMDRTDSMG